MKNQYVCNNIRLFQGKLQYPPAAGSADSHATHLGIQPHNFLFVSKKQRPPPPSDRRRSLTHTQLWPDDRPSVSGLSDGDVPILGPTSRHVLYSLCNARFILTPFWYCAQLIPAVILFSIFPLLRVILDTGNEGKNTNKNTFEFHFLPPFFPLLNHFHIKAFIIIFYNACGFHLNKASEVWVED